VDVLHVKQGGTAEDDESAPVPAESNAGAAGFFSLNCCSEKM